MAVWIKADGRTEVVAPGGPGTFTLDELHRFVGGYIEIVKPRELPQFILFQNRDGSSVVLETTGNSYDLVINEEGVLKDLPTNQIASELAGQLLVGDVLLALYPEEVE